MPTNLMLDLDNAFSMQALTTVALQLPKPPTLLGDLGIFDDDSVSVTTVAVEYAEGSLKIVNPSPRGGPGETIKHDKARLVTFPVPHFQRDDSVQADEVQSRRAFGTTDQLETVMERVAKKIQRHKNDLEFTKEHQRIGAIAGKLTDRNGNVYADLFQTFGITQPAAVSFALGTDTTKVDDKCTEALDKLSDAVDMEVGGETTPVTAVCGTAFWSALINHPSVRETYMNWQAAKNLQGDRRVPFEFGGIRWVRYRTHAKAKAGNNNTPLIPDDTARFVIKGVPDLYIARYAPADYIETVNTEGEEIYARMWPMDNHKGYRLEVQTNVISLCTKPKALIRATL